METTLSLIFLLVTIIVTAEARTKLHFKKHGVKLSLHDEDVPDQCLSVFCGSGRECRLGANNKPECICMSACKPHHKPVCGSDGRKYENHCELHRAACLENRRITIAHNKECFYTDDNCDEDSYVTLKDLVLRHHMQEFTEPAANTGNAAPPVNKKFSVSMMFGYYDADNNQFLDSEELDKVITKARLQDIAGPCTILDLLRYDDIDLDKRIDIDEFYAAFGVTLVSLPEGSKVVTINAFPGEGLSLKCDISADAEIRITWKRKGVDLSEVEADGIRVLNDKTLYFTSISTLHAGNYICHSDRTEQIVQTHILKVQVPPQVKVCPESQTGIPESSASIECRAFGIPHPELEWEKNGAVIDTKNSELITMQANNTGIQVNSLHYEDSGSYTCNAINSAGKQKATSSLLIEDTRRTKHHGLFDLYYVFHKHGIKVYDPNTCQLSRSIQAVDSIVVTGESICTNNECSWAYAVQVSDRYIYASQPKENRVIVLDIVTEQVVQTVKTDNVPVELRYVKYLDEVWVLCWGTLENNDGLRTIEVIQQASEAIEHETIHTQPIGNHFDLVQEIFIPPSDMILQGNIRYVYVVHKDEMGLHKIDLESMSVVKVIDLSELSCHPEGIAFVPVGGYVVLQCIDRNKNGVAAKQMILDYLTDAVVSEMDAIKGKPYVSPDSRYIVSVDNMSGSVCVQSVSDTGHITTSFDVHTNLHVSDIAFYLTKDGYNYDIFASSQDKTDILYIDLKDGKVEMVTGVGQAMPLEDWLWNDINRVVSVSGDFGEYLLSPAASSLYVVDVNMREVRCQMGDIEHGNVVVWVGDC
ncbi:follistatin-related protein 5-like [Glandiceps talaboti]